GLTADWRGGRARMFGYPCAFVGGNMSAGTFGSGLWVRLDEPQQQELFALGGRPFAPMDGRLMKGYVVAPPSVVADPVALRGWVERALAYTSSLPAKDKKPPAPKKAKAPRAG